MIHSNQQSHQKNDIAGAIVFAARLSFKKKKNQNVSCPLNWFQPSPSFLPNRVCESEIISSRVKSGEVGGKSVMELIELMMTYATGGEVQKEDELNHLLEMPRRPAPRSLTAKIQRKTLTEETQMESFVNITIQA